ncbi:hypothetical protein J6590_040379 [Homalodisca vitripennis]|nr:hypothetical protein J6590_040379 [Homalodisca vitripennis]
MDCHIVTDVQVGKRVTALVVEPGRGISNEKEIDQARWPPCARGRVCTEIPTQSREPAQSCRTSELVERGTIPTGKSDYYEQPFMHWAPRSTHNLAFPVLSLSAGMKSLISFECLFPSCVEQVVVLEWLFAVTL